MHYFCYKKIMIFRFTNYSLENNRKIHLVKQQRYNSYIFPVGEIAKKQSSQSEFGTQNTVP